MNTVKIHIEDGEYNGRRIHGEYTAVGPIKLGTRGWFVTVPGSEVGAGSERSRVIVSEQEAKRIKADAMDVTSNETSAAKTEVIDELPEEVALARMAETFKILNEMVDSMVTGEVTGLVIYGPPGVGKTWNVISRLNEHSLDMLLSDERPRHTIFNGFMTTLHLYKALYNSREKGQILVLDDIDSIFGDPESLNLLKGALDTTGKRTISYAAESKALVDAEIPNMFEFEGAVIFITNIDFDMNRGKIAEHLDAIVSRCHYLDLTIDTTRDKFLWLKHVTLHEGMLTRKGLGLDEAEEILDFIQENIDDMRELSLRMVLKLADLKKMEGEFDWKQKARITCMKRKMKTG